jgi:O-antigen biosynthesis protein
VQLSIIIVNYNVKYFLEYCIRSINASKKITSYEIIVVDNASKDGSAAHIQQLFPSVIYIDNAHNVGFAKANNQGLTVAKGEYILYLNPDTLVAEDTFDKCMEHLKTDLTIGALGVKMIDGSGIYLPESKRGFPDLSTSFYKISGIGKLFPTSKKWNKYYLGHLDKDNNHEIDVLAGCFIIMPRTIAQQLGGFDEDYFMYGEDIDLSYKIQKAGFKNKYLADTSIIHFKGESTKKATFNYLRLFYQAMIIFATKSFESKEQKLYIPFIKIAIFFRASLGIVGRMLHKIWMPILDATLLLFSLWQTKNFWARFVKQEANYDIEILTFFFSIYIAIWLITIMLTGGYDKPNRPTKIFKGLLIGALVTLAIYGLLPEEIRFSRGITLLGASFGALLLFTWRKIFLILGWGSFQKSRMGNKILLVGQAQNIEEVQKLLRKSGVEKDVVGYASIELDNKALGQIENLSTIAKLHQVGEIVFLQPDCTYKEMMVQMSRLQYQFNFKIYHQASESIIGSNSKETQGELYAMDYHYQISMPDGRRDRRTFDLLSSLLILIFSPVLYFITKNKSIFSNCLNVLNGKKTWMGYYLSDTNLSLPKLKPNCYTIHQQETLQETSAHLVNHNYARNYTWLQDAKFLWQQF